MSVWKLWEQEIRQCNKNIKCKLVGLWYTYGELTQLEDKEKKEYELLEDNKYFKVKEPGKENIYDLYNILKYVKENDNFMSADYHYKDLIDKFLAAYKAVGGDAREEQERVHFEKIRQVEEAEVSRKYEFEKGAAQERQVVIDLQSNAYLSNYLGWKRLKERTKNERRFPLEALIDSSFVNIASD